MGGRGDGHGHLHGARELEREGDVLFGEGESEGGVVEAAAQRVGQHLDHGSGGADFEQFVELGRVEAGLGAQDQALLRDLARAEDDEVVDQLDDAAGAGVAEVEDVAADGLEQRLDAIEGVTVAAGEQGEGAFIGAAHAAGDGAVDVVHALQRFPFDEAADGGDGVAAEVDVDVARLSAREDAIVAADDGFDLRRAGEGGEDDAAGLGDFGRTGGPGRAEFEEVFGGLLAEVVEDDVVAGFDQMPRHGVANVAGADESDGRHSIASKVGLRGGSRSGRTIAAARRRRSSRHAVRSDATLPSRDWEPSDWEQRRDIWPTPLRFRWSTARLETTCHAPPGWWAKFWPRSKAA